MVYISRAMDLVRDLDAVVFSPGYRLSFQAPYPAAAEDCYQTLLFMKENADRFGFRSDQIMAGGESAGGGLCAAVCMMARDRKDVNIAFQMPLYPMMDQNDTETSADNHGRIWNTMLLTQLNFLFYHHARRFRKIQLLTEVFPILCKVTSRIP